MITINNYVKVKDLEEAYELNQKRANRIIGGMMWMRLGKGRVQTAIDLSGLGLDTIEETEDAFSIGCMCTLRTLELHKGLKEYFGDAIRESVRHIVGVQFRNQATVGGSIFGRFGFSDVLTCFLALDTYVELYKGGIIPLSEFAGMKYDNDILVRLIVKKDGCRVSYLSERMTKTDFPLTACAVSVKDGAWRVSVGARPMKAVLLTWNDEVTEENAEKTAEALVEQLKFSDNMRASGAYRKHLAKVLVKREMLELLKGENC